MGSYRRLAGGEYVGAMQVLGCIPRSSEASLYARANSMRLFCDDMTIISRLQVYKSDIQSEV